MERKLKLKIPFEILKIFNYFQICLSLNSKKLKIKSWVKFLVFALHISDTFTTISKLQSKRTN